eukprot:TRINITY_DN19957_c0_g2_i1.p1 TRINITY_DN19957_c0_g2~~TRINITY_DN19957_c0_g2_i1.p1  ORF type:complete len:722 (+),score=167.44 TRINITY_DN19957_c0_g2_i1:36-2201(+)
MALSRAALLVAAAACAGAAGPAAQHFYPWTAGDDVADSPFYKDVGWVPEVGEAYHVLHLGSGFDGWAPISTSTPRRRIHIGSELADVSFVGVRQHGGVVSARMLVAGGVGDAQCLTIGDTLCTMTGSPPVDLSAADGGCVAATEVSITVGEYIPGAVTFAARGDVLYYDTQGVAVFDSSSRDAGKEYELRLQSSWLLISKARYAAWRAGLPRRDVAYLQAAESQGAGSRDLFKAKPVFDEPTPGAPVCDTAYRGCCNPKPADVTVPKAGDGERREGDAAAAVLLVSSAATFARRAFLMDAWLGKAVSLGVVDAVYVTLDRMVREVHSPMEAWREKAVRWLVGPVYHYPFKYMSDVALRVLHATEYMLRQDHAWYFMVDDDTVTFAHGLQWVMRSVPDGASRPYYVGHTSEFDLKNTFHGVMAFGGGGVLLNRPAARLWRARHGGAEGELSVEAAVGEMVKAGLCHHGGGDGAVCRCLQQAVAGSDTHRGDGYFINWRGFHQMDVSDKAVIQEMGRYNTACERDPPCPDWFDLISLWLLDVVARQPVVSLHHVIAFKPGAVVPGLSAAATTEMLLAAGDALPRLLLLRRACGASAGWTLCINFGYAVQVFDGALPPDAADRLLFLVQPQRVASHLPPSEAPQEGLEAIKTNADALNALRCVVYHTGAGSYAYHNAHPRPLYVPDCHATASAAVDVAAAEARVRVEMTGVPPFTWTLSIAHML